MGSDNELVYLGESFGLNLNGPEKRRVMFQVYLFSGGENVSALLVGY